MLGARTGDPGPLHVVILRRDEDVEAVRGRNVGLVARIVQVPFRYGGLQEGRLGKVVYHEVPGRLPSGKIDERVAPGGRVRRSIGSGFGCELACSRHRGELDEKAVPGLLLVRLQGVEARDVVFGQLREDAREGRRVRLFIRITNREKCIVQEGMHPV